MINRQGVDIKGILFDVDGTLYHQYLLRILVALIFLAILPVRPRRTLRDIRIINKYRKVQEMMRSQNREGITIDSQVEEVSHQLGIPLPQIKSVVEFWMEKIPLYFLRLCSRKKFLRMIKRWYEWGVPMDVYSDYPARAKLSRLGIES